MRNTIVLKRMEYKGKLLRLFREIMLMIHTPTGLTINELAEKLGVSYRTVYRDLKLLENSGFIPEEVGKGAYAIRGIDEEAKKLQKNLQFSPEEAALLGKALSAIDERHPLKKQLLEKLLSFSGMEDNLKALVKRDVSRNIELLSKAIRDKKQALLHNYSSGHSQSISDRLVEPYAFSGDGIYVICFELKSGQNKVFKIERIGEVIVKKEGWEYEVLHREQEQEDVFGMHGKRKYSLKLRMSLQAVSLLKEEYPASQGYIYKEDAKHYLFETEVAGLQAVGRFVLGLMDQVEVLGPAELKEYLEEIIRKRMI